MQGSSFVSAKTFADLGRIGLDGAKLKRFGVPHK
jgi:hypothetical protein